jgi:uncharacterized membrane protein YfcA
MNNWLRAVRNVAVNICGLVAFVSAGLGAFVGLWWLSENRPHILAMMICAVMLVVLVGWEKQRLDDEQPRQR